MTTISMMAMRTIMRIMMTRYASEYEFDDKHDGDIIATDDG